MAGGLARRYAEGGADLILVAGGDGTINEVSEGLAGSPVPLGVLPAGTANVLATEMRLGRNPESVARRLEGYGRSGFHLVTWRVRTEYRGTSC